MHVILTTQGTVDGYQGDRSGTEAETGCIPLAASHAGSGEA
jgi:hypothetical protein